MLFSLAIFSTLNLPVSAASLSAAAFGSILPDADNFIIYIGRLTNSSRFFEYTKIAHSMVGLAAAALISLLALPQLSAFALILGYSIHLITDAFNTEGCALLYPYKKEKHCLANVKLRGAEEIILIIIALSIFLSYII